MQNTLQWYPGHMAKTRRLIEENLKMIDVVVEILDARIPFSGRNPNFDDIIKHKPRLLVMNKADLADRVRTDRWIEWYRNKGIKVIPTVSWGEPNTFWFCFDGIPKGSVVAVSTIGVRKEKSLFMQGYEEMMRKIKP